MSLTHRLLRTIALAAALPVTALVQQMLGALINDGEADADHSAILHHLEGMAKVEVKRGG